MSRIRAEATQACCGSSAEVMADLADREVERCLKGADIAFGADIAALAPNATSTVYPWTEPAELKTSTINAVREFLRNHQPHDSTA